eukprot:g22496.t1
MGEILSEYFASVFTQEKINKEVVLCPLESIKVDKSPRPDGIYPRLLREAREEIAGGLYQDLVSSLATGEVPEEWRVVNAVPLFKKVARDNPGNYRPEVTKVIDEGRAVDIAYMDFSKAFDKEPHGRLIQKIKMLGIH